MPRGKGIRRSKNSIKSFLQMKVVILYMKLFYKEIFKKIEQKIDIKAIIA